MEQRPEFVSGKLEGTELGDKFAVPRIQCKGVAKRDCNAAVGSLYARRCQESVFHLCKHTRDALTLVTCEAEVHQYPHDTRIATAMDPPKR